MLDFNYKIGFYLPAEGRIAFKGGGFSAIRRFTTGIFA
jgi:hypothetical protein